MGSIFEQGKEGEKEEAKMTYSRKKTLKVSNILKEDDSDEDPLIKNMMVKAEPNQTTKPTSKFNRTSGPIPQIVPL